MPRDRDIDRRDDKQTKHWCLTINNPIEGVDYVINHAEGQGVGHLLFPWATAEDGTRLLSAAWGQLERGEEGTPHLQMYLVTNKMHRGTSFGRQVNDALFPNDAGKGRAHVEAVRDIAKMKEYVTKVDSRVYGPFKHGNIHSRGGEGEKAASATEQMLKTIHQVRRGEVPYNTLYERHASLMLTRYNGVDKMLNALSAPKPRPNMKSIVVYGPAGSGKSHMVREIVDKLFPQEMDVFQKNQGKWWDGYTQQPCVIIDDFDGSGESVRNMKELLDKGPCRLEIKGGTVPIQSELVFITTNTLPNNWYDSKAADGRVRQTDIDAVLSRIGLHDDPGMHADRRNQGLFMELHSFQDQARVQGAILEWLRVHWTQNRRTILIEDDEIEIPAAPVVVQEQEDDVIWLNDMPAEIRENDARPVIRDLLRFDWGDDNVSDIEILELEDDD